MAEAGRRRIRFLSLTALAVLALDIATKVWVVSRAGRPALSLLGGHLLIYETRNPGAAFSLAVGATAVFTAVAVAVIVAIVRLAPRLRSRSWALVFGLLLGGASGNLADRLFRSPGPFRGHVVDFIDFRFWPVFNVADSAIVCGGLIAVLLAWRGVEIDGRRARGAATAHAGDTDA